MAKPRVWVCRKCRHADCLQAFLAGSGIKVKKVGCQKICKGPVAGFKRRGRMEWFSRVDRAKPMVALLRSAEAKRAKKLPSALESHRLVRRSGTAPR